MIKIKNWIRKNLIKLSNITLFNCFPDAVYLKIIFWARLGRRLDLKNPVSFNEKLQWLKLNDRSPQYSTMVDKYAAKQFVGQMIGDDYIIPTLGIWNSFDDIDFSSLPNQFVLKCTHDSGGIVLCKDKRCFDKKSAKKKICKCLKRNFYWHGREWPYKKVKPRIIAEKFLFNDDQSPLVDYKLQCFHGVVDNILVCKDRYSIDGVRYFYFNKEWDLLPYSIHPIDCKDPSIYRPKNLPLMISFAEQLSAGLNELRVDFYEINGKVYFGEH